MARITLCAVVLLLGTGCSSYTYRSAVIKDALARNDPKKALVEIERIDKSSSKLLYLYEKGLALHHADEYAKSNAAFEEAEIVWEDLYTKSLTRETLALFVSETASAYRGEPFEALFVNYYKLFNYLYLGDVDGALVECRRLNLKLQRLRDANEAGGDSPFLQYVTGLVHELGGETNETDVSYRVALAGYAHLDSTSHLRVPPSLYCDLAENSRRLGDLEQARTHGERCANPPKPEHGSVTLFLESGWVAHKTDFEIFVPIFKGELDDDRFDAHAYSRTLAYRYGSTYTSERKLEYLLKVAIPTLQKPTRGRHTARIRARAHTGQHETVVAENLDLWAERAFEDKQGTVLVRALFRGLTKYLAKRKAAKKDTVLGWVVNAANIATETADTRSWASLPGRILMGRIDLPAGTYDLEVSVSGNAGVVHEFTLPAVEFVAGRKTLLNYRVY